MYRGLERSVEITNDKSKSKQTQDRGTTKRQFHALFGFDKEPESSGQGKELKSLKGQLDAIEGQPKELYDAQINIWNGSLTEEDVIHLMRTNEVVSSEVLTEGRTRPRKITLQSGIVGVFKQASQDSKYGYHSSEIAAYEIDKMLELKMVPLTVEREIDGEKGSFQLWVDNLRAPTYSLPNDVRFFDLLISNSDRSFGDNYGLSSKNDQKCVLYDNARAFYLPNQEQRRFWPQPLPQPSSNILENARQINMEMLNQIQSLPPEQKDSFLERRDALISAIEKQSQRKGKRSFLSKCWS